MKATVIPCGGAKLDNLAPARELYTGSMFKDALRTAELIGNRVLILSAKHGLVELDDVLDPYDVKMGDTGSISAREVAAQLVLFNVHFVDMLLPKAYAELLIEAAEMVGADYANYFEGSRGIGEQKGRLARIRRRLQEVAA